MDDEKLFKNLSHPLYFPIDYSKAFVEPERVKNPFVREGRGFQVARANSGFHFRAVSEEEMKKRNERNLGFQIAFAKNPEFCQRAP